MKVFLSIITVVFLQHVCWGQMDLLPVAKDGKWGLIKRDGSSVMPPVCDYIEYQAAGSKFVFDMRGKMGVIDYDGTIILKPFFDEITFFTPQFGAFKLNGKWRLYHGEKDILETDYDSITVFINDILLLHQNDTIKFFSLASSKSSTRFYRSAQLDKNLMLAEKKDGLRDLLLLPTFTVIGNDLSGMEAVSNNISLIYFTDGMQLFSVRDQKFISEKYDVVRHEFENWFVCQSNSDFVLLDPIKDRSYKIPVTDEILEISGGLMTYYLKDKAGAWNLSTETEILEPKYDGAAIQDRFIFTQNGPLFGLVNSSGKEIFPTEYTDISNFGNVYLITKDNKVGVASPSGKILEPCAYNKIEVYEKNVKCYAGKRLVTLSVDESGTVKDRTVYDEYMSVSFEKPRRPEQNAQSLNFSGANVSEDLRDELNRMGWFQTKFQREVNGVMKDFYGNWGMKNENDSIVIRARYKDIDVSFSSSYTIAYLERRLKSYVGKKAVAAIVQKGYFYKIDESIALGNPWFHIVNHRQKVVLGKEPFMTAQIDDFRGYSLARAVQKVPVLIDSSGAVIYDNITYYDSYTNDHLRICEGGVQTPLKRPTGISFPIATFFTNMGFYHYDVDPNLSHFYIKGGKWFFINRKGEKINSQPFDFAFPFQNNRSIVLRKGKWGVVDTNMTEIVPIVNQVVERIYSNGNTFFKVVNAHSQKYFYQRTSGTYTETDYSTFSNYKNGLWFVKHPKNDKWALVDTLLNVVIDFKIDAVYGRYGDYTTVRMGEEAFLLDRNGQIVLGGFNGATHIVPLKHNRFKIEKSERNFHVIDASGNILIPPGTAYEIIASNENYIFYKDYSMSVQAWSVKPFILPKKTILISGSPDNELLLLQKGKNNYLYSIKTGMLVSKKPIKNVISLEKEGYIFADLNGLQGIVSYSGDTILPATYTDIKFNDRTWGIAKISYKEFVIINEKGQKKFDLVFTDIFPDSEHYELRTAEVSGVINLNGDVVLPFEFKSIETYYGDYYKTSKSTDVTFYDRSGNFLCTNDNAKVTGMPTTGWIITKDKMQYFYDGYINRTLPFGTIIPVSSDGYILQETARTGVYSYEGDTVVPPYYHQVKTDRELFQVRFFNSYGYFDHNGKSYFDPMTVN